MKPMIDIITIMVKLLFSVFLFEDFISILLADCSTCNDYLEDQKDMILANVPANCAFVRSRKKTNDEF